MNPTDLEYHALAERPACPDCDAPLWLDITDQWHCDRCHQTWPDQPEPEPEPDDEIAEPVDPDERYADEQWARERAREYDNHD